MKKLLFAFLIFVSTQSANAMPMVQASLNENNKKVVDLLFPYENNIQSAVFQRNGYLWIVYNDKVIASKEEIFSHPLFKSIDMIDHPSSTILRIVLEKNVYPSVQKKGNFWILSLSEEKEERPALSLIPTKENGTIQIQMEKTNPVEWIDPETQEHLIAFPLSIPGEHVTHTYTTPAIELPQTIQGFVIAMQNNHLSAEYKENKWVLSSLEGLHLTPDIPFEWQMDNNLLDFSLYKDFTNEDFNKEKKRLTSLILNAPAEQKKELRKELARLYLSQGFGAEALSILQQSSQTDEYLGLKGAALTLMERDEEALKTFDQIKVPDRSIHFWKSLVHPDMSLSQRNLLSQLPQKLSTRLSFKALEKAFLHKNTRVIRYLLDKLQSIPKNPYQEQAYLFYKGLDALSRQQRADAFTFFQQIPKNPFSIYSALAEYEIVNMNLENQKITLNEAVSKLENIQYRVRNTSAEPTILRTLAALYRRQNQYTKALRTYKMLLSIAPDAQAPMEMTRLFTEGMLHNQDKPPIERIAFYYEFKELVPNNQTGDEIMHRLIHDFVSLDLLDEAYQIATLLTKHRLEGEEKQIIALEAALAALINHKPQEALKAANLIQTTPATEALAYEKKLIEAESYRQLGQKEKMRDILKALGTKPQMPSYFHPILRTYIEQIPVAE